VHRLDKLTLKALLDASLELHADRPALSVVDGENLTYRDFGRRVAEITALLLDLGLGPGDHVGLYGENMPNWGAAYFAVTTLGAVAVPILPDFHFSAVHHILRHAECKAVFVSKRLACRLDDGDEAAKAALVRLQQEQARRAAAILGARAVHFGDLPDNRFDSLPLLDVVRRVEALVREVGPGLVLTHHHGDLNVDHAVTARAVLTAARPLPDRTTRAVLSFEAPSSTEWAFGLPGSPFRPTLFVDIAEHLQAKLEALAAYGDEMRPFPHPRSAEAVRHLAALRGATAGRTAAEAFEILHWTM
jgi:LmbE family N-acetylglucosaminyl deacetylase